jgi:predicted acyl esterase
MVVERDVRIPMADGIALAADVFRPASAEPIPVIMSMGPYGKSVHFRDSHRAEWDRLVAQHPDVLDGSSGEHMVWELADTERWVPHGYAVVRVDSRGAGRSRGTWTACPRKRPLTSAKPSSGRPHSRGAPARWGCAACPTTPCLSGWPPPASRRT